MLKWKYTVPIHQMQLFFRRKKKKKQQRQKRMIKKPKISGKAYSRLNTYGEQVCIGFKCPGGGRLPYEKGGVLIIPLRAQYGICLVCYGSKDPQQVAAFVVPFKVLGTFRLDYEYEIEYGYHFRISNHGHFQSPCSSCWFQVERVAHGMECVCVVLM